MSGDALDASFVADAENLAPDTFSNLARLNGLVSGQIDGLSSSSSPNTKKRNLEELALLTTVVGNPQSAVTPQQHYHQGASSASSPVSLDTAQLRCESIWACHSCRQDRVSGLWFQGLLVVCGSDQQHETNRAAQNTVSVDYRRCKARTDPTSSCYSRECDS